MKSHRGFYISIDIDPDKASTAERPLLRLFHITDTISINDCIGFSKDHPKSWISKIIDISMLDKHLINVLMQFKDKQTDTMHNMDVLSKII